MSEPLLNKEQAAKLLGVSTRTLDRYRHIDKVQLGEVRIGGLIKFRPSDLDRIIQKGIRLRKLPT